jgi:lambda repressor-like predicted transcriptional regulator
MHPEQIKADLRMKGVTIAALADQLELCGSTVSQVISGKGVSARVRSHIAQITGHSVEVLWPPKQTTGLRRTRHDNAAVSQPKA